MEEELVTAAYTAGGFAALYGAGALLGAKVADWQSTGMTTEEIKDALEDDLDSTALNAYRKGKMYSFQKEYEQRMDYGNEYTGHPSLD